ncbi:MAG: MFS transporter, partial [Desulfovibrio sp.]
MDMRTEQDTMKEQEARRQIFGWAMYDWANSAYVTTVAVAVLPVYFADVVVGESATLFGVEFTATSLWGYAVSLAGLFVFLLAPFFGAVADFSAMKKRFLTVCCYVGSAATVGMFFLYPGGVWLALALFLAAQICFVGGNVFYDAFLPHVSPPGKMDRVSGKGFAFGYIGGGLHFALCLGLIAGSGKLQEMGLPIDKDLAARLALATAGLWWGGFALVTLKRLKEPQNGGQDSGTSLAGYIGVGWSRVSKGTRAVLRDRRLLIFLIGFLFYNDGIQTVIAMATIYGRDELGFTPTDLMLTLLIIQFVAIFGAFFFSRLAEKIGTKLALMAALVVWTGIAVYGYFISSVGEFYILGAVVGLVLGGSQALSRSL